MTLILPLCSYHDTSLTLFLLLSFSCFLLFNFYLLIDLVIHSFIFYSLTSWGTRRCTGKQSKSSVTSFHTGIPYVHPGISYPSVKSPLLLPLVLHLPFANFPVSPFLLPLLISPFPFPPSPSPLPISSPHLPLPVAPLSISPTPLPPSPSSPYWSPTPRLLLPVSPSLLPPPCLPLLIALLPLPIAPSQSPLPRCSSPRLPPTNLFHVHPPHLPTSFPAPSPCILIITCT